MKKHLLKLFYVSLLLVSASTIAQPTLTAIGCNPVIGYTSTTVSNGGFAQGNSGANQTWNLASIGNTGSSTSNFVSVNSTPNGAQFSNANLAVSSGGAYSFLNVSITASTLLGIVALGSGTVITYSNGEDGLRFPFTFGNTYTDQWAATFTSGIDFFRTGSTTVTADGYGTLITPNGTYNNVLRIHFVQNYNDSSEFVIINYVNDEYFWYKDGIKEALANTSTFSVDGGTPSMFGGYAAGSVGLENNELSSNLILFPNPASETINLTLQNQDLSNANVKIISQLGQDVFVLEKVNSLTGNNVQLDVANLRNGIYTLQILLKNNDVINKRFTISK